MSGETIGVNGGAGDKLFTSLGRDNDNGGPRVTEPIKRNSGVTIIEGYENGRLPVVGWLVCIEGTQKGKSYEIFKKINTIGRSVKYDLNIDDRFITRDVHAKIAYDSRHNTFTLLMGNNQSNIYLNDRPVYESTVMKAFDRLEFDEKGKCKFVFVPLCCESFKWDEDDDRG